MPKRKRGLKTGSPRSGGRLGFEARCLTSACERRRRVVRRKHGELVAGAFAAEPRALGCLVETRCSEVESILTVWQRWTERGDLYVT